MTTLLSLLFFIAWLIAGATGILFICFAGIPFLVNRRGTLTRIGAQR